MWVYCAFHDSAQQVFDGSLRGTRHGVRVVFGHKLGVDSEHFMRKIMSVILKQQVEPRTMDLKYLLDAISNKVECQRLDADQMSWR